VATDLLVCGIIWEMNDQSTNFRSNQLGFDSGIPNQQQKRHSSLLNSMINNKRSPGVSTLMHKSSMTSAPPQVPSSVLPRGSSTDPTLSGQSNMSLNQALRNQPTNLRQSSRFNHHKTPTPSTYDIPSSPNNQMTSFASALNQSDLSDSQQNDEKDVHLQSLSASNPQHQLNPLNPTQPQPQQQVQQQGSTTTVRSMSDEEQQLAAKLKETYKNIVNYEEIVQKNCIEITMKINQLTNNDHLMYSSSPNGSMPASNQQFGNLQPQSAQSLNASRTSELSNDLWTVYHHNLTLLNNYYDFLLTALKPSSNQTNFKTGKNIVEIYKIPRRMWVYGVVGFLEVLKNIMAIFQDHEICSCFISYCFNIISNLADPVLEMEGWWSEKLGDLSRMAIALYASKFIDWKIAAEYWYSIAMKTLYGHGKIYYHMCTVQQDNLDALVNIGKSVICRDPFVPTQHYLRLVVENICAQRNILSLLELPIIDFIKIHKVLLSIYTNRDADGVHDTQIQYGIDLVTRYGLTFGSDSNGYNFFTREFYTPSGVSINDPHNPHNIQQPNVTNSIEKMNFWFHKGSLFAIANINHLIGFGDAKNPFAKIFQLPEALKERKDKKDKKRKSRTVEDYNCPVTNGVDGHSIVASELSVNDWFYCLQFINKSVLELSIRILNHYLIGPKQASTSHVIVWLYFLISVAEATRKFPNSEPMFSWLFKKLFPWESFINYLNSLLSFVKNSESLRELTAAYIRDHPDYIQHFNENEFLPEVWKCWGTLWFDVICEKVDFKDLNEAGVDNANLFDLPICGTYSNVNETDRRSKYQIENDNDERIARIILLSRFIADNYNYGLVRTANEFKYDEKVFNSTDSFSSNDPFTYMEEFLLNDGRFVQNNLLQTISQDNLYKSSENLTKEQIDSLWFGNYDSNGHDVDLELGEDIIDEEGLEGYADSEFEDDSYDEERQNQQMQYQEYYAQSQQYYNGLVPEIDDKLIVEGNLGEKMDSNITYITLDTNIWLKHCGRIFKCVRDHVFKVSIPLIVFQELRALRKSAEATIADAATRSVIIIRELYLTREILPLRFDGTVASDINETTEFENNSNWRSSVDETILNAVNEYDEIGKKLMKGLNIPLTNTNVKSRYQEKPVVLNVKTSKVFRYCILVTDDRNMRLRAKAIGLTSFQSKWLFTQLETVFPDKCVD